MGGVRLLLALSVLAGHAGGRVFGIKLYSQSAAVNLFFIISGFYMAMILTEKYVGAGGNAHFYINRVLRLYPTYFVALALALVINLALFRDPLNGALANATLFGQIYYLVSNAIIFGQALIYIICVPGIDGACAEPGYFTLNPPSWSIAVELVFYMMAPFIVRSLWRSVIYWLLGVAYFLFLSAFGDALIAAWKGAPLRTAIELLHLRFYFIPASFMFFGLGAIAYHLARRVRLDEWPSAVVIGLAVAAVMVLTRPVSVVWWYEATIFAACVPVIFYFTRWNAADRFIGELSYPVYMLHFPIIIGMREFLPLDKWFATEVAIVTLIASIFVHLLVERPVDDYRAAIAARPVAA